MKPTNRSRRYIHAHPVRILMHALKSVRTVCLHVCDADTDQGPDCCLLRAQVTSALLAHWDKAARAGRNGGEVDANADFHAFTFDVCCLLVMIDGRS